MADNRDQQQSQQTVLDNVNLVVGSNMVTVDKQNSSISNDMIDSNSENKVEENEVSCKPQTVNYTEKIAVVADGLVTDESGNIVSAMGTDGTTYRFITESEEIEEIKPEVNKIFKDIKHDNVTSDSSQMPQTFQQVFEAAVENGTESVSSPQDIVTIKDPEVIDIDFQNKLKETEDKSVSVQMQQQTSEGNEEFTVATSESDASAPLGSSLNPIRIIQQGNQYTSLQQLTTEQLTQIMQVVQQQNVKSGENSNILYNPQTQTRIVYKVMYPSELHGAKTQGPAKSVRSTPIKIPTSSITVHQKRPYKKRKNNEDEEEPLDVPELSKEEKERRKKLRPKTRSGRVSKPPKRMREDYKHIHPLDWDEDYDDSDGGYSDFRLSDSVDNDSDEEGNKTKDKNFVPIGQGTSKPKEWKCKLCPKCYIGRGGLLRHFRTNPDHVTDEDKELIEKAQAEIEQNESIHINMTNTSAGATNGQVHGLIKTTSGVRSKQYKSKLREAMLICSDEDLMEVMLPRVAKIMTAWELILTKAEQKGRASKLSFSEVLCQFQEVHSQIRKMVPRCLKLKATDLLHPGSEPVRHQVQINDESIARSLGVSCGLYNIHDPVVSNESTLPKGTRIQQPPHQRSQPAPLNKIRSTGPETGIQNTIVPKYKPVTNIPGASPLVQSIANTCTANVSSGSTNDSISAVRNDLTGASQVAERFVNDISQSSSLSIPVSSSDGVKKLSAITSANANVFSSFHSLNAQGDNIVQYVGTDGTIYDATPLLQSGNVVTHRKSESVIEDTSHISSIPKNKKTDLNKVSASLGICKDEVVASSSTIVSSSYMSDNTTVFSGQSIGLRDNDIECISKQRENAAGLIKMEEGTVCDSIEQGFDMITDHLGSTDCEVNGVNVPLGGGDTKKDDGTISHSISESEHLGISGNSNSFITAQNQFRNSYSEMEEIEEQKVDVAECQSVCDRNITESDTPSLPENETQILVQNQSPVISQGGDQVLTTAEGQIIIEGDNHVVVQNEDQVMSQGQLSERHIVQNMDTLNGDKNQSPIEQVSEIYIQEGNGGQEDIHSNEGSFVYQLQTDEGTVLLVREADGNFQVHSQNGQEIPMDTIKAFLSMDTETLTQSSEVQNM